MIKFSIFGTINPAINEINAMKMMMMNDLLNGCSLNFDKIKIYLDKLNKNFDKKEAKAAPAIP